MSDPRRRVPRVDAVLAHPTLSELRAGNPDGLKSAVRQALDRVRAGQLPADLDAVAAAALASLAPVTSLREVLNATGTVVHTNLGRAPLSAAARAALQVAAGAVDVELDLATGVRAGRGRGTAGALRAALPDAEAVLVVNNGAAAVLLAVTALAAGRDAIISRGELVEIGDGFRLPELLVSAGARLREIGTTNRTRAADYAAAIGPETGCLLKVHPSNFRVTGFTAAASVAELTQLGPPVVVDVGSGLLVPDPMLPDEPDITTALQAGAGLVTASGDKLLGGPQAGILAGRADLIERCRRHPLARALRVDKLTLAALEATVRHPATPVREALHADPETLHARATRLREQVGSGEVVPVSGVVGGGGGPGIELPGWALALPAACAEALRLGTPVVLARVHDGRCLVDPRAVDPDRDPDLAAAIRVVLQAD